MTRRRIAMALAACCLCGAAAFAGDGENNGTEAYGATPDRLVPFRDAPEPYRRFFEEVPRWYGGGREATPPAGLTSVRLGLLAPLEGSDRVREGRSLQRGVELAVAEANAQGGLDGVPFEIVAKNDQAIWGASSNTLVEFAYVDRVWTLIGSIDSNSTHVALRAALKAEMPIVNVGSTDPTVTETGIPWIARLTPDDRQTGYALAHLVFEEWGVERVAVMRSTDRYGRFGVKEFRDAARRLARPLPMELLLRPGQDDLEGHLDRLVSAAPQAIVLWLGGEDAGRVVRRLRERGIDVPVAGPDRLVSEEFLAVAGDAAEGVTATDWLDPTRDQETWQAFEQRYRAKFGIAPDAYAAYGYDAANLVVGAIRDVGLNRTRLRDALVTSGTLVGVAGRVRLDATSNNVLPPAVVQVQGGRFVPR